MQYYLVKLDILTQLVKLFFNILEGSKGIGLFSNLIQILIFLGLIVNISLVVFTNNALAETSLETKLIILFLVENLVMFFLFFTKIDILPKWFSYKDIIELEYKNDIKEKLFTFEGYLLIKLGIVRNFVNSKNC